jgi:hypothetical protein
LSTTTISSSSAYIGSLTVGSASDYGTMNVGGLITATGGINAAAASGFSGGVTISNTGLSVTGTTTIANLSNTGWNCNAGYLWTGNWLYVAGNATIAGSYISNSGNLCNGSGTGFFQNLSNTGWNCNSGLIYTGGNLNVTGTGTFGGTITASNGISTTTISSGSITATNFYGNGSFLTGISGGGGGGSSNLVVSNVTGTALLNTGTSPAITSNLSGVYFIITNSGFSNIYIWDYLSSGTQAGYYNVLVNQTGTSLTVTTTNLNITRSGYITIPAYANATILYSPSNGYANYFVM